MARVSAASILSSAINTRRRRASSSDCSYISPHRRYATTVVSFERVVCKPDHYPTINSAALECVSAPNLSKCQVYENENVCMAPIYCNNDRRTHVAIILDIEYS